MTISGFTLNNGATNQPSSMTGTVPSTVGVGDVLVVVSSQNTATATHTISGGGGVAWHLQSGPDDNSSNERTYVWTGRATASSASSTVSVLSSASGRLIGAGWCGSGLTETGMALGLHSVTSSGTSMVFPSVTVAASGSTLVGLAVMRTGSTTAATLTAPAGCTVDAASGLAIATSPEYAAVSLHQTATVGTGPQSPGTGTASATVTNAQLYTLAFPVPGVVAAVGIGTVTADGSGSATASGASGTGTVTVGGSATPTGIVSASGVGTISVDGAGTPTLPPPPVQFLPLPPMDDQQRQGLTVAVYDSAYTLQGYANDYETCAVTFQHLDVGTGTLVLSETHPLVPTLNLAGQQVVPVTVTDRFGHRWTGRVDKVSTDDGDGSTQAVPGSGLMTVTLIDEWTWLKRLLASPFGPDPRLGYVTGDTEFDTRTGPIETVAKSYISDALTRVYGGGAPFAVVPAPVSDPSVAVTFQAKWTPLAELLAETLRTYSWALTITLWLPGDVQPVGLVAPLTTPTLVVDMHHGADNAWIVWDDDTFLTRKVGVQAPVSCGAVVGGAGSGTTQTFYSYSDPDLNASQGLFGFPEQYLSSSNATDPATDAAVQFAKTSGSLGVEASVEEGVPWSYGDDFMVGDVVGLRALGLDVRERVTAVQMVDDRANGYRLVPTIGEDTATLTPLAALFRTSRELGSRISSIETGN